jgi:hypothetical protein
MTVSSSSTHLVIGLAVLGVGLVVAGVRMSRRKAARAEMAVEATSGDEHAPGEVAVDGTKVPPEPHTGASCETRLLMFLFFTFAFAVPFWLFGGGKLPLPIKTSAGDSPIYRGGECGPGDSPVPCFALPNRRALQARCARISLWTVNKHDTRLTTSTITSSGVRSTGEPFLAKMLPNALKN